MTDLKQSATPNDGREVAPSPESSATLRWAFINGWKVEPQSDDRAPVLGQVAASTGSSSARRSSARQTHQAMFKEWSRERHD